MEESASKQLRFVQNTQIKSNRVFFTGNLLSRSILGYCTVHQSPQIHFHKFIIAKILLIYFLKTAVFRNILCSFTIVCQSGQTFTPSLPHFLYLASYQVLDIFTFSSTLPSTSIITSYSISRTPRPLCYSSFFLPTPSQLHLLHNTHLQ